jgi:hypothetical protein
MHRGLEKHFNENVDLTTVIMDIPDLAADIRHLVLSVVTV